MAPIILQNTGLEFEAGLGFIVGGRCGFTDAHCEALAPFTLTYNRFFMAKPDIDMLQAALAGYQHQIEGIQARFAEVRSALGVKGPAKASEASSAEPKRRISAAGRAWIAAAQRTR
jgi:hypothetical protein